MCLVTGGRGFIGTRLVKRLREDGHSVVVWDIVDGRDVRDITHSELGGVDAVYHLAANADISKGHARPELDFLHTVVGTFRLLEAMRVAGCKRIVYTSGSGVYGDAIGEIAEFRPHSPVSPYGAAKSAAEAWIHAYSALYGIQSLIYRPANITGPGCTHGVVYDFVQKLQRDPSALTVLGDGHQHKAYMHVDDAVDALCRPLTGTFNLTSGSYLKVRTIVDLVTSQMGVTPVVTYGETACGWPGDVPTIELDGDRLTRLGGWIARHSAAEAVCSAVDWLTRKEAA